MNRTCRFLVACTSSLLLNVVAPEVQAQAYPSKPVKLVVPLAPGGGGDLSTRMIGAKLQDLLKQSVIVENRPGANGVIGTVSVVRAEPDGYTLLTTSLGTMTPTFIANLPLDPIKSLEPISLMYRGGFLVLIGANVPARTIPEFIAYAKANPGKMNLGVATTVTMMAGEVFKKAVGIDLVRIVYKGEVEVVRSILAGEVHVGISTPTAYAAPIAAGTIRPIAATDESRNPLFPSVPTLREAGVKDFWAGYTNGWWAPLGTPQDIIQRLSREFATIAAQPDVKEYFRSRTAAETVGSTPEEFRQATLREQAFWAEAARIAGYKPE